MTPKSKTTTPQSKTTSTPRAKTTSPSLSNSDKKHLRRIGHGLSPVVTIGSKGLSPSVLAEVNRALNDHELIKIKLAAGDKKARQIITAELCAQCRAEVAQSIGHVILLFKKTDRPDPKLSNLLR